MSNTNTMNATANTTCAYLCKEAAPAGILRGHLVCPRGKFLGEIRKTGDDEFTVYGWDGIVGVHKGSGFRKAGTYAITASKSLNQYSLR